MFSAAWILQFGGGRGGSYIYNSCQDFALQEKRIRQAVIHLQKQSISEAFTSLHGSATWPPPPPTSPSSLYLTWTMRPHAAACQTLLHALKWPSCTFTIYVLAPCSLPGVEVKAHLRDWQDMRFAHERAVVMLKASECSRWSRTLSVCVFHTKKKNDKLFRHLMKNIFT